MKFPRVRPIAQGGWLAVLVLLLLPAGAFAADYYGGSTTIPYVFQTTYDGDEINRVSLYEYANIHAEDFGTPNLSFHFAGWGRWDAADPEFEDQDQPGDADLTYAYVMWTGMDGMLTAYLGRHFVVAGPTAEILDGADLEFTPMRGLSFRGFAGVPTYSKLGERDGDFGWGGRVSYGYDNFFEIGVAYSHFLEEYRLDRDHVGADLYAAPVRFVDLIGHVYYDTVFEEIYDAQGILTLYPITNLRAQGSATRLYPSAFLGMSSYFSVFSAETIDQFEGELSYLILNRVRVIGGGGQYVYDEAQDAARYGGGAELLWGVERENNLGARYHRLDREDDNGYAEVRGYLFQRFLTDFHFAANSTTCFLDEKIYNVDTAFDGDASVGWRVLPRLDVQATGVYRSGPYYEADYRGLLKIAYNVERTFQ